jgi:acyl-CoA synthetase (AMP-forming)/AMP-acid ligase II
MTSSTGVRFIGDQLQHWADTTPDAEAIAYGDRRWSYARLRDRVRRVAGALVDAGVGRGDRVAFLDKNHPACLEVTFGAAAIGAANAVLNWRLSGAELQYVINDSGAGTLFVGADLWPAITAIRGELTSVEKVVVVGGDADEYEPWLSAAEPLTAAPAVSEDDPCLVMYSSGTTGRPKGVLLTHRGLIAHTVNMTPELPFSDGDRSLVAMPLYHVGGTCYALVGIHAGVPSTLTRDPDAASLFAALAGGATHAFLVPTVVAGVLGAGQRGIAAFARLKYLAYGASPMPLPLLRAALAAWPATRLVQVYGMTELSGVITQLGAQAHRDQTRPERLASAGTPLPGAEVRVVDPVTGQDVAPGTPGELWFRSEQRMAGYLNDPEATAATITADGWLRTGDIGRVDDGGFVFIEDRLKDMVLTGGENVYSPEVERVIVEHPAVADVAVIGVPDDHMGEAVKAVVTLAEGQPVTTEEIIAFARERLAHYKCPRTVDIVSELPRNHTGKILKRAVRTPYWEGRNRWL